MNNTQIIELLSNKIKSAYSRDIWRVLPSGYTKKIMYYIDSLSEVRRDTLFKQFAERGICYYTPEVSVPGLYGELKALVDSMPLIYDLRFQSFREMSLARAIIKTDPDCAFARGMSDDDKKAIEAINAAKAPEIRKAIKMALYNLLGAKPENVGGGYWRYPGRYGDFGVVVSIDYGSRGSQLQYSVFIPNMLRDSISPSPSLESIYGFGLGHWDQIEIGTESKWAGVLNDCILEVIELTAEIRKLKQ